MNLLKFFVTHVFLYSLLITLTNYKLQAKSTKCIFKTIPIKDTNVWTSPYISRHVLFYENSFPFQEQSHNSPQSSSPFKLPNEIFQLSTSYEKSLNSPTHISNSSQTAPHLSADISHTQSHD